MAQELDVLTVRLQADVAQFHQQLDRARSELSKFGGAAAPAVVATERIGKVSTGAVPGLRSLNGAFITLTRQITGVPSVVGQFTNVLGTLAIGVGPMALALAGVTALAAAFALVTREARAAKKAAEEAVAASNERWRDIQTQGDADLIDEQNVLRVRLVAQAEKLERAKAARENKEYIARLNTELLQLQRAYVQTTIVLDERRADRQRTAAEQTANKEQQAAAAAAAAWKRAYAEIEAAARQFVEFHPDIRDIVPSLRTGRGAAEQMGFVFPDDTLKANNDALKRTIEALDKATAAFLGRGAPPVGGGPGFFGTIGENISSMLDPTMIASGIATGFISTGINAAIGGLTKLGASLLGFGEHVRSAANVVNDAVRRINDQIITLTGTDLEQAFVRARQAVSDVLSELFGGDFGIHFADFTTFDALLAELQRLYEFALQFGTIAQQEAYAAAIELATAHLDSFSSALSDATRNIPSGYKIALAEFNATTPSPAMAGAVGTNLTITLHAEPAGFFRSMEGRAVQIKKTGGVLAWELV